MKTCLIYGHIGLDLDVAFNLLEFYKELGFRTAFSDKLYNADLLVITRGGNKPLDLSSYSFRLIHCYDYGGWVYDSLISSLPHSKTIIFSTAPTIIRSIIDKLGFPENQIHLACPPVAIEMWSKKIKPENFKLVHIGNYKPIDDNVDVIKGKFNDCIKTLQADVWGLGWDGIIEKSKYHGKLGLFKVSSVYSQSKTALGLMYPFQRAVTFSGRFWHAPLNGCVIFSEPGLYTQTIPGIIETDFSSDDILKKLNQLNSREEVQNNAINYWQAKRDEVKKLVIDSFSILESNPKVNSSSFTYFKLKIHNTMRKYYQVMEFFKFK